MSFTRCDPKKWKICVASLPRSLSCPAGHQYLMMTDQFNSDCGGGDDDGDDQNQSYTGDDDEDGNHQNQSNSGDGGISILLW